MTAMGQISTEIARARIAVGLPGRRPIPPGSVASPSPPARPAQNRYMPRNAVTNSNDHHSLWTTQSGRPRVCPNPKNGPIGHRYP